MKFVLLLAFLLVIWLWRTNRSAQRRQDAPPPPPTPEPHEAMVRCALCHLHVPQAETVAGQRGLYCCADHRHRAES